MKLSTRLLLTLLLLCAQLPLWAATYTVTVGDNFYSPQFLPNVKVGDVVTFQWQAGNHPTMSDSSPAAFPTFQMNSSARTQSITFTTVGTFPYHCTAHGAPGVGMYGSITVSALPTPTLAQRPASASLSLYPNPVRDGRVTVTLGDTKTGDDYVLRFTNIIGSEVRRVVLKPELTATGQPVDVSALPAGIYFCSLVLNNDKVVSSKRITVQ